jgi:hypothetical protein
MRDYAKKDFSIPKRTSQPDTDNPVVGVVVITIIGAVVGFLLGYGLLYTGV